LPLSNEARFIKIFQSVRLRVIEMAGNTVFSDYTHRSGQNQESRSNERNGTKLS